MEINVKTRLIAAIVTFCVLAPIHVLAESTLTDRYSDSELIQIIKAEGYSSVTKIKDGVIRINIDGRSYMLINNSDGDLQTYYSIGGVKVSYEDINEWNRTKHLSRAYLDSDKDPVLESDLLSNGGITNKHVTEFFRVFQGSVKEFREFIVKHNKS